MGLTSLIVGGAGIANAVSAFVDRRIGTIATLKCLGAPARDVFWIYLTEIMLVALLGIAMGIAAGAATPVLAHTFLQDILPLPLTTQIEVVPLALTAALGLLVTIAFSIWPLARTHQDSSFRPVPPPHCAFAWLSPLALSRKHCNGPQQSLRH